MQKRIIQLLSKTSGLKAREIASKLELERKAVSQHLHENLEVFIQDPDTFGWSVVKSASFVLELTCGGTWLTETHFEKALSKAGSPLDADHGHVTIKIPAERKILLCAAAKILALTNQLAAAKKKVELDFSGNKLALSYLDRAGFIDRLDPAVKLLPKRPSSSAAQQYNANNIGLVELVEITKYGDKKLNVPERIKNSFIKAFGENHSHKLFTVVAEFVGNVEEHSATEIPGFAGLQCYGNADNRPRVVTVISDSGVGICQTLRPALDKNAPDFAKKFDPSLPVSDPKLILHAILKGGLSSRATGGGAGLHSSHSEAEKLNATIKIRQENFSVKLEYKAGVLENKSWTLNLPTLIGTHIIFEFSLTKTQSLLKLEP
jgi:hypothetical protein